MSSTRIISERKLASTKIMARSPISTLSYTKIEDDEDVIIEQVVGVEREAYERDINKGWESSVSGRGSDGKERVEIAERCGVEGDDETIIEADQNKERRNDFVEKLRKFEAISKKEKMMMDSTRESSITDADRRDNENRKRRGTIDGRENVNVNRRANINVNRHEKLVLQQRENADLERHDDIVDAQSDNEKPEPPQHERDHPKQHGGPKHHENSGVLHVLPMKMPTSVTTTTTVTTTTKTTSSTNSPMQPLSNATMESSTSTPLVTISRPTIDEKRQTKHRANRTTNWRQRNVRFSLF